MYYDPYCLIHGARVQFGFEWNPLICQSAQLVTDIDRQKYVFGIDKEIVLHL